MSEERGTASGLPHESTAGFEHPAENRTAPVTPPTPGPSGASTAVPRLAPGDHLANRYTVLRFVARGGMGEVYEVRDDTLRTRVALKTILPEFSSDSEALERFRREVLLARRITHPNVCRIHDLSSGEVKGQALHFLTMEFLDGETLSRRLRSRGRMATDEVLPLLRQIAPALDAAHAEGVVHRDFKTSNVMLVTREGTTEVRPVITDFGIAHAHGAELEDAVTGSRAVGTPEYMAPEQVTGGAVGPAADVYALGIVLYEMLTGHTPFGGGTPFQVALRRVQERPRPPREAVPGLEPRWNEAVLRCLEVDPADRFARAQELVQFLETGIPPPRRGLRRRVLRGLLLGALPLVVVLALNFGQRARQSKEVAFRPRPVAAIGMVGAAEDLGQDRWIPAALGQLLELELAAKPSSLRIVPAKSVAWARRGLGLEADSVVQGTDKERLASLLGTQTLLFGRVRRAAAPGQLEVLIDPVGGMPAVSESFTSDDVLSVASRLGERLRQELGLSLNQEERGLLAARRPRSAQAARFFAEGMSRLVADDLQGAQRLFAAAYASDGSFHAPVLAEAESWLAIGNLRQARNAAQRAKDLARQLSVREQRETEIALARASEDEGAARVQQRALYADWPDDPRLAEELIDAASTIEEGQAALQRWRQASPAGAFDFGLGMEEAALLARSQGPPAADAAFESLEDRARALASSYDLGEILRVRAITFARSDHSRSLAYVRRAQEEFQRGGFLARLALAKGDEALYLREKGDPRQEVPLRESLVIYRRLGMRRAAAANLVLLGWSAFYQGDVIQARARLQEIEDEYRYVEASPSWVLGLRAWVEWTEGNLAESRRSLQDMRKRAEIEGSEKTHAGMPNLEGMILTEEDRIPEAIAVLEHGREQFASLGAADYEWKCALMVCRASCRGGRPAEGLACLSRVDAAQVKNSPWLHPQFEAECLIDAGDPNKAKLALARASTLGETYGANHLVFEMLRGRVETLEGRSRPAAARLRSVAAEARRRHWNGLALESELTLGSAELASGLPGARKRLLAVQEEASRRGFVVIGRRAAAARAADGETIR